MRWKWIAVWSIVGALILATVTALIVRARRWDQSLLTFQGAVIRRDDVPQRQLPIANVEVTATRGATSVTTQTDGSGFFRVTFPEVIWPGQTVILSFRHDDYWPLDLNIPIQFRSTAKRDYVAAMEAMPQPAPAHLDPSKPETAVSNIQVRYTINFQSEENIGSAVRTFQVANHGNVPCRRQAPCSPDGNWKASMGSVTMDAGSGNEFRNVRASCIAGPCPFTRIQANQFQEQNRIVTVSALNWSDTTTFQVEAEVFRVSIASSVRHSYPVVFGRTLNFTLPPTQEGVSIEAELNGTPMVFPLGPELYLSWATCSRRTNKDGQEEGESIAYRCELKPGYKF